MRPPRHFKRVRAATPEDVMMALADFAAQVPKGQEIVELGVFHGRTALQLAWGARQGNGAHVTAIDLWDMDGNTYGPPFTDASARRWAHHHVISLGYSQDITLVQGFSADVAARWVAEQGGRDGRKVGLLFVDADHSREGARQDIESWAPHLAEGARIAVDDYEHPDWPGVKEALDELVAEGVLEPVEVYHERLAVTRLATLPEGGRSITSEGVRPSPIYPVTIQGNGTLMIENEPTGRELEEPWADVPNPDNEVSTGEDEDRTIVKAEELAGVAAGTSIDSLSANQLRGLVKVRGIGPHVDRRKRSEMLAALRDGQ
jgi:MMP 1-O-methyltransferase